MVGCSRREIGDALAILQRQDALTGQSAHHGDVGHRSVESHGHTRLAGQRLRHRRSDGALQILAAQLHRGLRDTQWIGARRRRGDGHTGEAQRGASHGDPDGHFRARHRHRDHLMHWREAHRHERQVHRAHRCADEHELAVSPRHHDALQLRGDDLDVGQRNAGGVDDRPADRWSAKCAGCRRHHEKGDRQQDGSANRTADAQMKSHEAELSAVQFDPFASRDHQPAQKPATTARQRTVLMRCRSQYASATVGGPALWSQYVDRAPCR